eukprot:TRINITY_DN12622_c0_g1_i1.p1 TRINITY_DN12622_c0_g1~~TRINITY_DN12622_c0_g1_i1.p1  ORF type:complete len:501 (+),score=108.38 TRINITY_DN12622_c0_g1_i1:96-1598(+)
MQASGGAPPRPPEPIQIDLDSGDHFSMTPVTSPSYAEDVTTPTTTASSSVLPPKSVVLASASSMSSDTTRIKHFNSRLSTASSNGPTAVNGNNTDLLLEDDSDDVDELIKALHEEDDEKVASSGSLKGLGMYHSSKDSLEWSRTRTNSEMTRSGSMTAHQVKIDGHGRLVAHQRGHSEDALSAKESKESTKTYNERLIKWTSMMRRWEKYATIDKTTGLVTVVGDKVKSRARKGIPDAVRVHVYMLVLDVERQKEDKGPKFYEELNAKKKIGTGAWDETIRRDVNRTNPDHVMFMNKEGAGQEALFRVLRAYSLYDEELGYCQGMGFFVSVMLTYVPEEDAFWLLVGLLSKFNLREYYLPSLIGIRRNFFVFQKLLQFLMPKLSKHLEKNDYSAPLYASRWFGTMCAQDFCMESTLRIWDILIVEGPKIIFQVGLAVMKRCKRDLKKASMDEFTEILRQTQRNFQPDDLIKEALQMNIKSREIETYGKKFDELEMKLSGK